MPKLALAKIPANILQAELARRKRKGQRILAKLLRQRVQLDAAISELEAMTGTTTAPKAKLGRPPGRKPKAVAPAAVPHKRGTFPQTGAEFIVGLLKKGGATSTEINRKWTAAGRNGTADVLLSHLTKAGTLKRTPLPKGQRGSTYTLKGAAAAQDPRKRGTYALTAAEFILGLLKKAPKTTSQIGKKWAAAGRGGKADNALTKLVSDGKLKREPLPKGQKGSTYSVA